MSRLLTGLPGPLLVCTAWRTEEREELVSWTSSHKGAAWLTVVCVAYIGCVWFTWCLCDCIPREHVVVCWWVGQPGVGIDAMQRTTAAEYNHN